EELAETLNGSAGVVAPRKLSVNVPDAEPPLVSVCTSDAPRLFAVEPVASLLKRRVPVPVVLLIWPFLTWPLISSTFCDRLDTATLKSRRKPPRSRVRSESSSAPGEVTSMLPPAPVPAVATVTLLTELADPDRIRVPFLTWARWARPLNR